MRSYWVPLRDVCCTPDEANVNHHLMRGDRWVVAPEIFWKARGD
jgi:hypothetical protein